MSNIFFNKWPCVKSDETIYKYQKFIENNEHLKEIKLNKIFGVIKTYDTVSYLYAENYFTFCKKKFFPVNYYLYKLFLVVREIRKKNYLPKESYCLQYPFFNCIEKTDVFVKLIVTIDSLHKIDQLNFERFEPILTAILQRSEHFENFEIQLQFVVFLIAFCVQRPLCNLEKILINFKPKTQANFKLFKSFITKNLDCIENFEYSKNECFNGVNQVFGKDLYFCNEKTNLENYEHFFTITLNKYFESKSIIFASDFRFMETDIRNKKTLKNVDEILNLNQLNNSSYFTLLSCSLNKIRVFSLNFVFINELKSFNTITDTLIDATQKVVRFKKNNKNSFNLFSINSLFELNECYAQDMLLLLEVLASLIDAKKTNISKTKIIHYEKKSNNISPQFNRELLFFYLNFRIKFFSRIPNKSWHSDLAKIKLKELISIVMYDQKNYTSQVYTNIFFKESNKIKKSNLTLNNCFNFDLLSNVNTSNVFFVDEKSTVTNEIICENNISLENDLDFEFLNNFENKYLKNE